jgi:hypothetical protein
VPTDHPVDPLTPPLADAYTLRDEMAALERQLKEHVLWQSRIIEVLSTLHRHLDATDERERELRALLQHRDEPEPSLQPDEEPPEPRRGGSQ